MHQVNLAPHELSADSLQNAVLWITRQLGMRHDLRTLLTDVPLPKGKLSEAHLLRLLDDLDIEADFQNIPPTELEADLLPLVFETTAGDHAALTQITDNTYIIVPLTDDPTPQTLNREDFAALYGGRCLLFRQREVGEKPRPTKETFAWLLGLVKQHKRTVGYVLLASFFINLFALAAPFFVMNVYDRVLPNEAYETLWVLVFGIITAFAFELIFKILRQHFQDSIAHGLELQIAGHVYRRILNARHTYSQESANGLLDQVKLFETIKDFLSFALTTLLIDLPFAIIFMLVIYFIGGWLVAIPLAALPIVVVLILANRSAMVGKITLSTEQTRHKNDVFLESLRKLNLIRNTNSQPRFLGMWESLTETASRTGQKHRKSTQTSMFIMQFLQQVMFVGLIVLGTYLVAAGQVTLGGLIASSMLLNRATAVYPSLLQFFARRIHFRHALQKLDGVLNMPQETQPQTAYIPYTGLQSGLKVKDVTLHIPEAEATLLKNISFEVKKGEKVGIVGMTGAGKTTLAHMLAGFAHPSEGEIYVDNIELNALNLNAYRADVSYIMQDVKLLHGTLRQNLLLAKPDATPQELKDACTQAGLAGFISRHPKGLDMLVDDELPLLSKGQRQMVEIARGILKNGSIFVLDDAMSQMDNRSEARLIQALQPVLDDKTVFVVTHRAGVLKLVDRLMVVDRGRIIADGPKDDVLAFIKQKMSSRDARMMKADGQQDNQPEASPL